MRIAVNCKEKTRPNAAGGFVIHFHLESVRRLPIMPRDGRTRVTSPDHDIPFWKGRWEMPKSIVFASLTVLVVLAGCQAPAPPEVVIRREPRLESFPLSQQMVIGRSTRDRPIEATVIGDGPDTILAIATIHGNEYAGTPLLEKLSSLLAHRADLLRGRKVIIVPVANPDGMDAQTRFNARNVDLNRNFAAQNRLNNARNGGYALSEPETLAIARAISRFQPDRILTIHQPLNCIDYDGPGLAIAEAMAGRCSLPVRKLGAQPGSLGAFAGETLNIPTITLELRPNDHRLSTEQLWAEYGNAVIAAIVFPEEVPSSLMDR